MFMSKYEICIDKRRLGKEVIFEIPFKIFKPKTCNYTSSWVIYFCTAVLTGILGSKRRETQVLGAGRKQIHNVISSFHISITTM